MSKFNYSRFGTTFRWTERYSRNTMIKVLFLALAVYLFILLTNTITASYKGMSDDMQQLTLLRAIRSCGVAYFIWVVISGTWFCPNIKTKQQRITIKMLPATNLEKFLSHIAWLAMQLIGMALIFCLADVIRVALFAALGLDWIQWGIPVFFDMSGVAGDMYILGVKSAAVYAAGVAWLLWAQSLYALGNILLNRYNGVIVSAIHVILIVALVWIVVKSNTDATITDITLTADTVAYIALATFALLGIFNWVMAYRLYSRMQVINNKLINL